MIQKNLIKIYKKLKENIMNKKKESNCKKKHYNKLTD